MKLYNGFDPEMTVNRAEKSHLPKVLTREHFRNAFDPTGESFSESSKNPSWAANWQGPRKGSFLGEAPGQEDA